MPVEELERRVAAIFERAGIAPDSARTIASSLIGADLEGIPSHGVMLVPMYVERLRAGSVSGRTHAEIVHDRGAAVVLDAQHMLGQLSSHQAVQILVERAARHGLASVAVRNAFHFGTAGYWARAVAGHGLIGIALSNTRPLMPPPGGAERVVGNNPLAVAFPSNDEPLVVDLAMSATAMGRIRLAEASGKPIPEGWATDAEGRPTTDPAAAIKGMLLPAAGPKGFGLAVAIDLLCGGLSGGAITDEVNPLYGNAKQPYGCAHFFLAIDPAAFGVDGLAGRVRKVQQRIRSARRAAGTERIYAPGDLERARRAEHGRECPLPPEVFAKLEEIERSF